MSTLITFPHRSAAQAPPELATFGDYREKWFKTLTKDEGTKRGYKSSLDKVWGPSLDAKLVRDIVYTDLTTVMAIRSQAVTGKTINNDLIPLRAVFASARRDRIITLSPAEEIENEDHQSPPPDPFTPDERVAILADLRERYPIQVWAYYATAFATALRPSEEIVL